MRIGIIGAGIAALSCADMLQVAGHTVILFDKRSSAGGRMATRRVVSSYGVMAFEDGAREFIARDTRFAAGMTCCQASRRATPWRADGNSAWIETSDLNAVVKGLAQPLVVHWNSCVDALRRVGHSWFLNPIADDPFDAVIIATPADQAAPLLVAHEPTIAAMAQGCPSAPCWTAMASFTDRLPITKDIVRNSGIIGWAARNHAKHGRHGAEAWVMQATAAWSSDHLEDDETAVVDALLSALAAEATQEMPAPVVRMGHCWRDVRTRVAHHGSLWNETMRIGAVGDWLLAPRIESAWLSGRMLADQIIAAHR